MQESRWGVLVALPYSKVLRGEYEYSAHLLVGPGLISKVQVASVLMHVYCSPTQGMHASFALGFGLPWVLLFCIGECAADQSLLPVLGEAVCHPWPLALYICCRAHAANHNTCVRVNVRGPIIRHPGVLCLVPLQVRQWYGGSGTAVVAIRRHLTLYDCCGAIVHVVYAVFDDIH